MLMATVMLIATGCGCQQESTEGDQKASKTEANTFSTKTEESTTQEAKKTSTTDFTPSKSLEERKAVSVDDYIRDGKFYLTEYAEALGYTHLTDPDYPTIAFYGIKRGNVNCFFCYSDPNLYVAWFDKGDGYVYRTSLEECSESPEDYILISKNQRDRPISKHLGLDYIEKAMKNIATADEIDFEQLSGFSFVERHTGPATYLSNGLLKVREIGDLIDSVSAHGYGK